MPLLKHISLRWFAGVRRKTVECDVLVVGGGPAGSSVAYQLAKQGVNTCVVEKYNMPRYKTCGGGVNVRAANYLPFSIERVVERTISRYRFTFRGQKPFEREYHQPLTYLTQRMNLDKFLLDQAQSVGAQVIEGVTIRRVFLEDQSPCVLTNSGERLTAKVIVGADGANSVVARDLGLMKDMRRELALESEIGLQAAKMDEWGDKIEVDLFSVTCGYGWVFPKGGHISIGVGGLRANSATIKDYNEIYLRRHNTAAGTPLRFSGHILPVRNGKSKVVRGNALLIGDAAGLLEPFTGEGIGYAIRSGQLAAESISAFLDGKEPSLEGYAIRLDAELTPQLITAEKLMRAFNRFPRLFYRILRDNYQVWRAVCLILRGERHMTDASKRLGKFEFMLNVL
jgi:geranylgeranyl reductase family protein